MDANTRQRQVQKQDELAEMKRDIKNRLADDWLQHASQIADRLLADDESTREMLQSADAPTHSLHQWKTILAESKETNDFEIRFGRHENVNGPINEAQHSGKP